MTPGSRRFLSLDVPGLHPLTPRWPRPIVAPQRGEQRRHPHPMLSYWPDHLGVGRHESTRRATGAAISLRSPVFAPGFARTAPAVHGSTRMVSQCVNAVVGCPQWVISGHPLRAPVTSDFGSKADVSHRNPDELLSPGVTKRRNPGRTRWRDPKPAQRKKSRGGSRNSRGMNRDPNRHQRRHDRPNCHELPREWRDKCVPMSPKSPFQARQGPPPAVIGIPRCRGGAQVLHELAISRRITSTRLSIWRISVYMGFGAPTLQGLADRPS